MAVRMLSLMAALTLAAPAFGQDAPSGDAAKGEKVFKQCMACHVVENAAGEVLAGKAGKVGPNLYGLDGRKAGSVEGYDYSPVIIAAGDKGLVWTEAEFVAYVSDPTAYLDAYTGDGAGRSKMTFRLRKEADARDVYAYIAGLK